MLRAAAGILVCGVAVLTPAACHRPSDASPGKSPPPVAVRIVTLVMKSHPVTEEVIGTVRAKLRATVEAKVSGRISRMAVDLGQPLNEGDIVAEIDAQEIKARLDQAHATREQAEQDLNRYTVLLQKQVAAKQDFDAAQAPYRVADAAAKEAQTMLGYIEVRAPFAGVISRRLADVGDFAGPGKALVEIENLEALRFEADVPEGLIDKVRRGQELTVRIPSVAADVQGTVAEIAPSADPASRTFLVRIDLPKIPGLRSGQFGGLVSILPHAARRHGRYPVFPRRNSAGARIARCLLHRHLDDRIHGRGGHRRAKLAYPCRLHRAAKECRSMLQSSTPVPCASGRCFSPRWPWSLAEL